MAIKIIISGCCGRMGARISSLASQDEDLEIVGATERKDNPNIGKFLGEVKVSSNLEDVIKAADVLIEFTTPEATLENLEVAARNKKAMVIGTTAIDKAGVRKITDASRQIPIVFSPNMSVGVNLLFDLVEQSAQVLKGYKINITEAHHKHKKDAPSGTAKRLAKVIKDVKGDLDIPIESIREGEIIGDHTVSFDGEFETLQLAHHAKSRDVFASGALLAAKFTIGKKPGLYSMQDVLKN